jgi:GPH family glycoside/pentoside/hexuronide:cation symporter
MDQATQSDSSGGGAGAGKLSFSTLASYGSSMVGLNGMWTMMGVHLMFFYTDTILMSATVIGIAMAIAQVWDAVTDPVLGYISDNTTWKWGRRRPYILIGAIPASVAFFFLFSPPQGLSDRGLGIFFTIIVILFFSFRTIWETPYFALAPELTLDYDERTRLSAYQQVFATFGDILGTMAPLLVMGMFATTRKDYSYLAFAIAVMAVMAAVSTYKGTRENPAFRKKSELSFSRSLITTLKNRPYLILVIATTFTAVANQTNIMCMRYIIKYWFQREDLEAYFFAAFFVGVFLSIPLWIKLINRIGKKTAYIIAMVVYSVILCLILTLRQGDYMIFMGAMVLAGVFNIALWLIPGSIMPDIIEWDQLQVGERREGAYYGVWTLIRKAGGGCAFIIVGAMLQFVGYEPDVEQSQSALLGIKLVFGPIPALLLAMGVVVFWKFPITKQVHEDILRKIDLMQRQKEEEEAEEMGREEN